MLKYIYYIFLRIRQILSPYSVATARTSVTKLWFRSLCANFSKESIDFILNKFEITLLALSGLLFLNKIALQKYSRLSVN